MQRAIRMMYNMEYGEAIALYRQILRDQPFHPLAPLGLIAVQWYDELDRLGYRTGNANLFCKIDSALLIYRRQMMLAPDDARLPFFFGTTMGLKARLLLAQKNWPGVLFNGYNALRYIRRGAALDPTDADLQFPFGVFDYYVGVSSGYMQIASWILNTSGSKDEGLQQMRRTAATGHYGCYEARSVLAFVDIYLEDRYEEASALLMRLADEFPRNPYFVYLLVEASLGTGQLALADSCLTLLETGFDHLGATSQKEYRRKIQLGRATLAWKHADFNSAESELRDFIIHFDMELDYDLSNALWRLGQVYEQTGRLNHALEAYGKAARLDNRTTACRLAQQRIGQLQSRAGIIR